MTFELVCAAIFLLAVVVSLVSVLGVWATTFIATLASVFLLQYNIFSFGSERKYSGIATYNPTLTGYSAIILTASAALLLVRRKQALGTEWWVMPAAVYCLTGSLFLWTDKQYVVAG